MECKTSFGKPKIKFATMELAIQEAKKLNQNDKRIHKLVAYKCRKCFQYHLGSNGKLLKKNVDIYVYNK